MLFRSEREGRKDKEKGGKKERKEKKARAALMSFDAEDDGSMPSFGPSTRKKEKRKGRDKDKDKDKGRDGDRERKKRKEEPVQKPEQMDVDLDDDSMWVEKPAPEVVKTLPRPSESRAAADRRDSPGDGREAGGQRGRKRAVDFM